MSSYASIESNEAKLFNTADVLFHFTKTIGSIDLPCLVEAVRERLTGRAEVKHSGRVSNPCDFGIVSDMTLAIHRSSKIKFEKKCERFIMAKFGHLKSIEKIGGVSIRYNGHILLPSAFS
jgi:hypothetical protein